MMKENLKQVPIMPQEYKGEYNLSCGYTTTTPRKWTEKELEWTKNLMKQGYSNKEIAVSLGRSETSVAATAVPDDGIYLPNSHPHPESVPYTTNPGSGQTGSGHCGIYDQTSSSCPGH